MSMQLYRFDFNRMQNGSLRSPKVLLHKLISTLLSALMFFVVIPVSACSFNSSKGAENQSTEDITTQSMTTDPSFNSSESVGDQSPENITTQSTVTDPAMGLVYEIKTGDYGYGAYVTSYTGTSTSVTIPKALGGVDVVSVYLTNLSSVTSLDTSGVTALKYLGVAGAKISLLDLSKNTSLTKLNYYQVQIMS